MFLIRYAAYGGCLVALGRTDAQGLSQQDTKPKVYTVLTALFLIAVLV
jgi:hypothetical protein